MVVQDIAFRSADGYQLVGTLTLPSVRLAQVVVAAHGAATGTRAALLHRHLADFLPKHGVGAFVFDRRGEGESGGIADAPLAVLARDVATAADVVAAREDVDADRVGVWGHSQGGWIAPIAASQTSTVRYMIVVAGSGVSPAGQMQFAIGNVLNERGYPSEVVDRALSLRERVVRRWSGDVDQSLPSDLEAARAEPWFDLAYLPAPDDLTDFAFEFDLDIRPTLRRLRIPALLVYGETDRWVPIEESIGIWRESYGAPTRLTVARIPGAGHFPTLPDDPNDLDEVGPVSAVYEDALIRWLYQV